MVRKDRKREGEEQDAVSSGLEMRKKVSMNASCSRIPEQLKIEILLRLPVKSLLRFRAVSRRWCHLFSTQKFVSAHVRTFNANPELLLLLNFGTYPEERYPLYSDAARPPAPPTRLRDLVPPEEKDGYTFFRPVGYCNGVACFRCVSLKHNKVDILIWNPSISKSMLVPVPISNGWGLVHVGFGFISDDYKLITATERYGEPIELGVYSLETGNWEIFSAASNPQSEIRDLQPLRQTVNMGAVFLNQSCHWYVQDHCQGDFIMSLNLVEKVLHKMALPGGLAPEGYTYCNSGRHISLYEGCLSVFGICERNAVYEFGVFVWVMKEYGNPNSWTKIAYGKLPTLARHVVGFGKGGEVIYSRTESELFSYDPVSKRSRFFADFFDEYGEEKYVCAFCQTDFYKESLFLLKGNNDEEMAEANNTNGLLMT